MREHARLPRCARASETMLHNTEKDDHRRRCSEKPIIMRIRLNKRPRSYTLKNRKWNKTFNDKIEICIYLGRRFFASRRRVAVYGTNVDLPI